MSSLALALGLFLLPLGPGADLGHGLDVAGGLRHAPLAQNLRPVHAICLNQLPVTTSSSNTSFLMV